MTDLIPSIIVLGLAAFAAMVLVQKRQSPPERITERRAAAKVLALTVVVQSIHFAEEAATGFPERLAALFNLPSMSFTFFVVFNLAWIGVWLASIPGLNASKKFAFFAAWFLAIAGMINGLAHPLLAVASGGYFPGLASSPIIGVVSVYLWRRLRKATFPARR